jgi:hypothetical protein
MAIVKLKSGDVFCSANSWAIGRAVQFVQKVLSKDNASKYGHAGIVVDGYGQTIEALWTTKVNHLDSYIGKPVLIARPIKTIMDVEISEGMIESALEEIEANNLGRAYPFWRLLFHLVPPIAKHLTSRRHLVCSELVAKYLWLIRSRHNQYPGTNPDDLADEWSRWKNFKVVFEGTWEGV